MKIYSAFIPLIAWGVAGTLKFCINYMRFGKQAVSRIGNGGFPSTHTSVVSSAVMYCGFKYGFEEPIFSLGVAFLWIVIIDALGIRRAVGKHAQTLNRMANAVEKLRESQGHTIYEIIGGLIVGTTLAYVFAYFLR